MPVARLLRLHALMSCKQVAGPLEELADGLLPSRRHGLLAGRSVIRSLAKLRYRTRGSAAPTTTKAGTTGGASLGVGRNETVVYTADELPQRYPRADAACVQTHDSPGSSCASAAPLVRWSPAMLGVRSLSEVAVKDMRDEEDARFECALHAVLHRMFGDAKRHDLTCIHPSVNSVDVIGGTAAGRGEHRLVLLRALEGDVLRLSPAVFRDVAAPLRRLVLDVLDALAVLHARGVVHLDVKPTNILWTRGGAVLRFVLGDYGVVTTARALSSHMSKRGPPTGTPGYISPLLYVHGAFDDGDNGVYDRLRMLLRVTENGRPSIRGLGDESDAALDAYFHAHKEAALDRGDASIAFKADLHSFALTVLDLAAPSQGGAPPPEVADFLLRCIFFRRSDFRTAQQASRAAARMLHPWRARRR
jgi:hypothetical protein